jgi:HEAT repeat protein
MAQDETVDLVSDLLEQLGSTERAVQRAARDEASARLKREPGFRETLYRLLSEGSPRARFSAAYVLFQEDRPTLRLLPALLDLLELEDGDLRWTTANMLATLGRMHGEVYPVVLHESLRAEAPQRRRMALYVLRELAPERTETKDAFLGALKDRGGGSPGPGRPPSRSARRGGHTARGARELERPLFGAHSTGGSGPARGVMFEALSLGA